MSAERLCSGRAGRTRPAWERDGLPPLPGARLLAVRLMWVRALLLRPLLHLRRVNSASNRVNQGQIQGECRECDGKNYKPPSPPPAILWNSIHFFGQRSRSGTARLGRRNATKSVIAPLPEMRSLAARLWWCKRMSGSSASQHEQRGSESGNVGTASPKQRREVVILTRAGDDEGNRAVRHTP